MTSHKTELAAPESIQSSDSSPGVAIDSLNVETRPLDAPEAINRNESSDSYSDVVAVLNPKWRVIRCRDNVQWVLQSRDSATAAKGVWRGRSHCRTKEALRRVCAAHADQIDPTAAVVLTALPDHIEAPILPTLQARDIARAVASTMNRNAALSGKERGAKHYFLPDQPPSVTKECAQNGSSLDN